MIETFELDREITASVDQRRFEISKELIFSAGIDQQNVNCLSFFSHGDICAGE